MCWMIDLFLDFFKESPYCSPYWLNQITLPSIVQEGSLPSTPTSAGVYKFCDDGHSEWYEVIPHCSFGLYFSHDE